MATKTLIIQRAKSTHDATDVACTDSCRALLPDASMEPVHGDNRVELDILLAQGREC